MYRGPAIVKSKIIVLVVLCSWLKIQFLFHFLSHDKLFNLTTSQKDSDNYYIISLKGGKGRFAERKESARLIWNPDLPWPFQRQTEWDLGRRLARGRNISKYLAYTFFFACFKRSVSWAVARRIPSAKRGMAGKQTKRLGQAAPAR